MDHVLMHLAMLSDCQYKTQYAFEAHQKSVLYCYILQLLCYYISVLHLPLIVDTSPSNETLFCASRFQHVLCNKNILSSLV